MANTFLNAKEYANVMLLLLKNNLVMGRLVDGRFNNKVTDQNGLTIHVKRPPQFIAKDGPTLAEQAIATGSTALTVDRYRNVHIAVTDLEAVQSWNQLMRSETMKSAASTLAHDVDLYLHEMLKFFPSHVGTPGETIKTPGQFLSAHTRLMEQSVPNTDLNAVISYGDAENIRASLLAGNISGVNRTALERTKIPLMSEIDAYASQHIKSVVAGTRAASGAAVVNGAAQNVNYVTVKDLDYQEFDMDGLAAGATVKKGEIFTIADVYAINNRSGETLPYLRQFVVMEDYTADGTGAIDNMKIYPPIVVAGTGGGEADTNQAFATVDSVPADGAAITFMGAAGLVMPVRAAWQKQAIQLVSARLETPMSDTSSFATDPETGISIRYWRGSDIATGKHIHRWDMIYGAKNVDPRLGTRISGLPA
ncbi:MAG: hypothetical protein M0R28_20925 [Pigmentiphaga sp.]|nr:hypothetical protein [Pigmentiphaga sp.]